MRRMAPILRDTYEKCYPSPYERSLTGPEEDRYYNQCERRRTQTSFTCALLTHHANNMTGTTGPGSRRALSEENPHRDGQARKMSQWWRALQPLKSGIM
jgi:hypothetical protein